jgi:hypothetical protein
LAIYIKKLALHLKVKEPDVVKEEPLRAEGFQGLRGLKRGLLRVKNQGSRVKYR